MDQKVILKKLEELTSTFNRLFSLLIMLPPEARRDFLDRMQLSAGNESNPLIRRARIAATEYLASLCDLVIPHQHYRPKKPEPPPS